MSNPEVLEPNLTKIADSLEGAEGPVFDKHGNFYMVAPERTDTKKNPAGDVLKVNLESGKVMEFWSLIRHVFNYRDYYLPVITKRVLETRMPQYTIVLEQATKAFTDWKPF